jgi:type IV secretion system protein TrbC
MLSSSAIRRSMPFVRLLVLLCMFAPLAAFAQETTKTLPYEQGLGVLYTSLTGPVPFAISLVGIVACGAMLIFGGEISGFMRTLVFIVLVVAVIVQATSVIDLLGGKWTGKKPGDVFVMPTTTPSIV